MLEAANLSAAYPGISLFTGLSLSLTRGETAAVLGPNGCGKSTLLSLLTAQKKPLAGSVRLSGRIIGKGDKRVGCILQTYGIFPWLTVEKNIRIPLEISGLEEKEIRKKVSGIMRDFSINSLKERYPSSLSGGEKQKTALARTMASDPELLLMDEPFSAIDALTREELQDFLKDLLKGKKITTLIVTHSIEEAVYLADTIYIMGKKPSEGFVSAYRSGQDFTDRKDPAFFSHINNIRLIMESTR